MIQDILDPRSYDHKQIKLSSNDRTYHYVDVPPSNQTAKDVPVVLLLHGFPDLWYGWRYQIQGLANAGFRVIVPSQMGYATTVTGPNSKLDLHTELHAGEANRDLGL